MWQTEFTYFHTVHWGGYCLSNVLDDFSRYIIAWKLSSTLGAEGPALASFRFAQQRLPAMQFGRLVVENTPDHIFQLGRDKRLGQKPG